MYKHPRSTPLERLAVKVFYRPTMQVGSHSFILPYYILVFALKTPRVDRLAMKIISHPAVRTGNHSFIMPHNTCRARTIVLAVKIISHPAVRMGNHSFIMPHNIHIYILPAKLLQLLGMSDFLHVQCFCDALPQRMNSIATIDVV